jgi:hypothetical protein
MPKRVLALLPLTPKRLPTRKKSPPPLYVTTPPARAGGKIVPASTGLGAVRELVGFEGGVVSGVINLESPGVEAPGRRPRHDERYHEA